MDMDTSWMDAEDVIEREPMEKVGCFYVYMNTSNEVNHIEKEWCPLDGTGAEGAPTKISRSRLLGLIQRKKARNGAKYRLLDIMQCNIPHDFTGLIESSYNDVVRSVITEDEIMFDPSLCIFHDINAMFFFYQEIPKYWDDVGGLKPALKISADGERVPKKKTKRVSFKELDLRHTKKIWLR
jgi:hypothetical protein